MMQKYRVTTFCAPPTALRMMVQKLPSLTLDISHLRFWYHLPRSLARLFINQSLTRSGLHSVSAGEPLNPAVIDTWRQYTGITICSFYGQTESSTLVSNYRSQMSKPGSMGRPAPGINVQIVDDDGVVLPPMEEGQIAVALTPTHPLCTSRIGCSSCFC